jgi:ABC-type polysaccharide/polyol phosphate export permease
MSAIATRLGDLGRSRELLDNLVRKELKVRYKESVFGFLWSLVTPLLMTAVFSLVFSYFLRIPVDDFAAYFLAGFLVWQFFANSVNASVGAIVSNGSLIRKVYFPRELLPLSLVISQGVHFLLALAAVAPFFAVWRGLNWFTLPAVLLGLVLLTLFTAGVSMLFAAANVRFRDLQELVQVIFLAWFYLTPVIYPLYFVTNNAPQFLDFVKANPMFWFVQLFHRALYGVPQASDPENLQSLGPVWPEWQILVACTVLAVVTFVVGYALFTRLAVSFAKEV